MNEATQAAAVSPLVLILYLLAAVLFIFGLKGMCRVRTAQRGNAVGALAMLIAIVATFIHLGWEIDFKWIIAGLVIGGVVGAIAAIRVLMTKMPEMVALFNGSGGLASLLVATSNLWFQVIEPGEGKIPVEVLGNSAALTTALAILIGGVTFSGSVVAFLKLAWWRFDKPFLIPGRHVINIVLFLASLVAGISAVFFVNAGETVSILNVAVPALPALTIVAIITSLLLGIGVVVAIGGADMPVVISLLNSYSGLAACTTGFVLNNNVLIVSGALVGASGLILTNIMCVAMNRTLVNVIFGGFGAVEVTGTSGADDYGPVRAYSAEEVALVLDSAESVIFAPGYGLAVAQAQHTTRELGDLLQKHGKKVSYAIHPVAGRMPGHMNVLLAEADVPYEQLFEMDQINPEFRNTDVVIILGANDVVNPAALKDPDSPIAGMPILEVFHARTTVMIKRSLSPGFAGIKNELFEYPNNMMFFSDAKKAMQGILNEYKEIAG